MVGIWVSFGLVGYINNALVLQNGQFATVWDLQLRKHQKTPLRTKTLNHLRMKMNCFWIHEFIQIKFSSNKIFCCLFFFNYVKCINKILKLFYYSS